MDGQQSTHTAFGPAQLGLPVLAHILNASADAIVVIDENRRYLYANPAAGEIAGLSYQDLIGRDFLDNIAPRMHETILTGFRKSLTGFPGRRSSIVVRPDGSERDIEYSTMSLHHEGRPLVASIFHDITDELQQEREASALAQIASSLTLAQSMDDTLNALAASVVRATRAVACSVVLVDESGQDVKTVGADGFPGDALEAYTSTWSAATQSDSMVLRALREQKTYVINDVRAKNLANPLYVPIHHIVRRMDWDVVVATPIIYHDFSLGVLCSYFGIGTHLSNNEIDILTAIANQAAVAIENQRLYQKAQGTAALEERQRLARELHDSVSQALYGIGLGARTARTLVDRDPQKAIEPVEYVLSLVEIGLAEMRALIFELQPESLEAEGLVEALRKQASTLPSRHEIEVDFADCDEPNLPLHVKEAVYRIAQEAIHNTVKHAQASTLSIQMVCTASELVLELRDNGLGFDTTGSFPGHLGLHSMRERAAKLDGQVRIESEPGLGVYINIQIPIERYAQ
ncbi:hypothetical protein BH20CHL1_BH20CHL1_10020 [soil metagenome]